MYEVLPFGLRDSPWVFICLVSTHVAHLRLRRIHIHYYLDDWLIVTPSLSLLLSQLQETLTCAQSLGFLINWEKSSLLPSQVPTFLGAVLDIPRLLACPADHRILAIQQLVQRLISSPSAPAHLWQQILCHLSSLKDLVVDCLFLIRLLQIHFLHHFHPILDLPDLLVPLSPQVKDLCLAWSSRDTPPSGENFQSSSPRPHPDHGCLQPRLGCFFTPSSSFRPLVPSGFPAPHQHVTTKISVFSSTELRGSGLGLLRLSQVGQLDSGVLYQSSGRHSLNSAVSFHPPPSHLVSSEEDYSVCLPDSRPTESCCGLSFQGELPSVGTDHLRQGPSGASLLLLPQPSSSTLLCEDLRPECLGSGCVLHPLVGLPWVRVPSVLPPPESSRDGCSRPVDPPFGGSVLAQETLVFSPPVSSVRSSEIPSGFTQAPAATYLPNSASESFQSSSYSLAALRSADRLAFLSELLIWQQDTSEHHPALLTFGYRFYS